MTNFEKYRDKIETVLLETGSSFAVDKDDDKISSCRDCMCIYCAFNDNDEDCYELKKTWLNSEYVPKKIKLPADIKRGTIIEVSYNGDHYRLRRFFGFSEDNRVITFPDHSIVTTCFNIKNYSQKLMYYPYARMPEDWNEG